MIQNAPQKPQYHADRQKRTQRRGNRGLQLPVAACSQILGGQHRSAVAAADGNHDKNGRQRVGSAHSRQRILADKVSHDHRIRHIVKLLEQVAGDHRQGKRKQAPGRASLCQIRFFRLLPPRFLFHRPPLSFLSRRHLFIAPPPKSCPSAFCAPSSLFCFPVSCVRPPASRLLRASSLE